MQQVETFLKKTEVKETEYGQGLFALEHIYQGETIIELPMGDYLFEPDQYSIQIAPDLHISCKNYPVGSTNHSCNPNAAVRGARVVAWSCIETGDEITIDYLKTESKLAAPFICECGYCKPGTMISGRED